MTALGFLNRVSEVRILLEGTDFRSGAGLCASCKGSTIWYRTAQNRHGRTHTRGITRQVRQAVERQRPGVVKETPDGQKLPGTICHRAADSGGIPFIVHVK